MELPSEGDYITCDVGYRGRIQTAMENLKQKYPDRKVLSVLDIG